MSVVDIGEAVFLVVIVLASIIGMVKVLFFDK
jgi:hypothetical protein